jgi:predicted MFS family arabinose efflux permease
VVAGFADGFTMLAAGRLISGAGAVIQSIFLVKMITEWFGEGEVITATAIMLTGWPTGIAIALATLGPIAEAWGWQAVMHLTAGGCAASLAVLWLGYRAPPGTAPPGRGVVGFRIPRRELGLICLGALVWSVYNVAYISYLSFGPALLIERGLDAAQAGIAVSLASWIALPAVPLGGYLADRIGRPVAMMTVCCLLAAATAAAIPQFDAPYALSAALGLFAAAPAGIIMAGVIGVMSPPFRAHGNAVLYTWFYAAMGLGPGFIGWAADLAGSVAAPMYLSAGVLVLSILLFIGFRSVAARSAD